MSCCSQTTYYPWWGEADQTSTVATTGRAMGADPNAAASGQWYLYIGERQGAMQFPVNGVGYDAGRLGVSRFLKVDSPNVLGFERHYGNLFSLLGASDLVTQTILNQPTIEQTAILPAGVTERLIREHDVAKAGDIVGANPALLAAALGISQEAARRWILGMRAAVGFGNQVNLIATPESAPPKEEDETAGRLEVFDFAVLHGVTPAMEDLLLQNQIHSSRDFIAAGKSKLAQILNKPTTVTAALIEELEHYLSAKGEKTKLRKRQS